ncbi:MAG: DUF1648 domain-containing protein [candidate division Zixibacteria bacterium]|nr:DUF1648 domain-containing protein [candidate division Zixibacteria bacterium]
MNTQKILFWLIIGVILLIWLITLNSYGSLPQQVPVHFDSQGQPDGWSEKSAWIFYMIPFVQTLLVTLIIWFRKYPHLYNFPQKDQVINLPPAKQKPIWEFLDKMMLLIGFLLGLTFLVTQYMIIEGAKNAEISPMYTYIIIILSVGWVPLIIYMLVRISSLVKAAKTAVSYSETAY